MNYATGCFLGRHSSRLVKAMGIGVTAFTLVYAVAPITERADLQARPTIAAAPGDRTSTFGLPSSAGGAIAEAPRVGTSAERVDDPRQCEPQHAIVDACIYE